MIELEISFEEFLKHFRKIVKQLDSGQINFLLSEIDRVHPLGEARGAATEAEPLESDPGVYPPAEDPIPPESTSWEDSMAAAESPAPDPWATEERSFAPLAGPEVSDVTFAPSSNDGSMWFKRLSALFEGIREEATGISPEELDTWIRQALEEVAGGGAGPL